MEEGVKGSKCVLLFLTANSSTQAEVPRGSSGATLQQHDVHTSICMQVSLRILLILHSRFPVVCCRSWQMVVWFDSVSS